MENRAIKVLTFSTMPALATEGWDPNKCSGSDYETPRADALYAALGVSKTDEEYALSQHADGRWALFGLTVEGHQYAVESPMGAWIVVGVGPTTIETLKHAQSSAEDWAAFDHSSNDAGRHKAKLARREGESWCVTVRKDLVTEDELEADDAVRSFCTELAA